jgi:hypothetical protein
MTSARRPNARRSHRSIFFALAIAVCVVSWAAGCGRAAARPEGAAATASPSAKPASPAAPPACARGVAGQESLTASVVVLGEMHGTAEIPAAFGDLVCRAAGQGGDRPLLVGLEIPIDEQAAIDRFLQSDGGPEARRAVLDGAFWHREYQDGRSSASRLDLLEALRSGRAAGMKVVVRAIDLARSDSAAARDAGMAAAVVEAIREVRPAQAMILVGDVHSRILKGYPWDPAADYLPMGAVLRQTYPDVMGLHVFSVGGTAWTCQTGLASECGPKTLRAREVSGPTPRVALEPEALDRSGWSGTLFMGALTASPPAIQEVK